MTSFNDFGLEEPILRALTEEGYVTPTPIQAQTIPVVRDGRDVVGIAQTGTGKTAAFALPLLHKLAKAPKNPERKTCRVLVLSPTRELSDQILESFRSYGRHLRNIRSTLAIGGVSIGKQVRALMNGVDVLVATPGRLLDLVQSNALKLDRVEYLVLDEADRMLDMGFIRDIRKIVAKLPKQRQTLFFSATMPEAIAELASEMLRDPVKVAVTPVASTVERVQQRVIRVEKSGKPMMLAKLLKEEAVERAIVFTRTKHGADKLVHSLLKCGHEAEAIHGNKSQNQRERVLDAFRAGKIRTLVATDIAARGIDVEGVSHVFNFDLPYEPESYVHRIGRTARAGAEGIAISFCSGEEAPLLRQIEKLIRLSIPATGEPHAHQARTAPTHRNSQQNRRNGHHGQGHGNGGGTRQAEGPRDDGRREDGRQGEGRRNGRHRNGGNPRRDGRPAHAQHAPRPDGSPAHPQNGGQRTQQPSQHDSEIGSVKFMRRGHAGPGQRPAGAR